MMCYLHEFCYALDTVQYIELCEFHQTAQQRILCSYGITQVTCAGKHSQTSDRSLASRGLLKIVVDNTPIVVSVVSNLILSKYCTATGKYKAYTYFVWRNSLTRT